MNLTAPPRASARSPVRSPLTEGGGGPSLDLNFLRGSLPSGLTFSRASSGTYFDATGTLQSASTNVPRFDYDPSTLAIRGLLIEEQRTNLIRNNTMVGGSAGVTPTNWTAIASTGVTPTVAGVGTKNGVAYVDVSVSGTLSGTATNITLVSADQATAIAASQGQVWALSAYYSLVSGSLTGLTLSNSISMRGAAGVALGDIAQVTITPAAAGSLTAGRVPNVGTVSNASTQFVQPKVLNLSGSSGTVVNFTIRIGLPQLELGSFATSVIQTTGSAATRAADNCVTTGTSWINQAAGSLATEFTCLSLPVTAHNFVVNLRDTSGNYRASLYPQNGASTVRAEVIVNGSATLAATASSTPAVAGVPAKAAVSWGASGSSAAMNGVSFASNNTPALMTGINLLRIGSNNSGVFLFNGWIRRIRYWKRKISDSEQAALTT